MAVYEKQCLVILAGGQSRRMGHDKALVEMNGKRLIDHVIDRYLDCELQIVLSSKQSYGTELDFVPDKPGGPTGPVGAIVSLCEYFLEQEPAIQGFFTVPVDAPNAPSDLLQKLENGISCAVASSNNRLHPVFAYWRCDIVKSVNCSSDLGAKTPSLQWLAHQCDAKIVTWAEDRFFTNINTPEDLKEIESQQ